MVQGGNPGLPVSYCLLFAVLVAAAGFGSLFFSERAKKEDMQAEVAALESMLKTSMESNFINKMKLAAQNAELEKNQLYLQMLREEVRETETENEGLRMALQDEQMKKRGVLDEDDDVPTETDNTEEERMETLFKVIEPENPSKKQKDRPYSLFDFFEAISNGELQNLDLEDDDWNDDNEEDISVEILEDKSGNLLIFPHLPEETVLEPDYLRIDLIPLLPQEENQVQSGDKQADNDNKHTLGNDDSEVATKDTNDVNDDNKADNKDVKAEKEDSEENDGKKNTEAESEDAEAQESSGKESEEVGNKKTKESDKDNETNKKISKLIRKKNKAASRRRKVASDEYDTDDKDKEAGKRGAEVDTEDNEEQLISTPIIPPSKHENIIESGLRLDPSIVKMNPKSKSITGVADIQNKNVEEIEKDSLLPHSPRKETESEESYKSSGVGNGPELKPLLIWNTGDGGINPRPNVLETETHSSNMEDNRLKIEEHGENKDVEETDTNVPVSMELESILEDLLEKAEDHGNPDITKSNDPESKFEPGEMETQNTNEINRRSVSRKYKRAKKNNIGN